MPIPEIIEPRDLSDYLAVLSRAVFQAGVSWAMIEKKWPGYLELFENFDPRIVAAFSASDIERIGNDPKIVRTRKKVAATVENARTILQLDAEHRGFRNYLRSFDSYKALSADMRKRFSYAGELSIWYFLFRVGERVPRFEDWVETIEGDHPRMQEMVALAREQGHAV